MNNNIQHLLVKPVNGLPPRMIHSHQSPSRPGRNRGVTSKFNKNQENQWPKFRAPTRFAQKKPLSDLSNKQNIYTDTQQQSLESKPEFKSITTPSKLDCPVIPRSILSTPRSDQILFQLPHLRNLRCGASPRSNRRVSFAASSPKTSAITPVTRRRLAVEGLRKAASDAAVRKMGLHGGFGWTPILDQSIIQSTNHGRAFENQPSSYNQETSEVELEDIAVECSKRSSTPIDNGSTTPCDASFVDEDEKLYSDSIILAELDDEGSTTPFDASYEMDHEDSILFDDLNGGSTTPLYDTSFSVDHEESDLFIDINGGSTTPADNSFLFNRLNQQGSTTPEDTSIDPIRFEISVTSL